MREFLGVQELFCILIIVVFTWMYACVKIHRTVRLKKIILLHINYKFNFNKEVGRWTEKNIKHSFLKFKYNFYKRNQCQRDFFLVAQRSQRNYWIPTRQAARNSWFYFSSWNKTRFLIYKVENCKRNLCLYYDRNHKTVTSPLPPCIFIAWKRGLTQM